MLGGKQVKGQGLLSFKFYLCYRHWEKLRGGMGQEWTHGVWLWAQFQLYGQNGPYSGSTVLMDRSVSLFPLETSVLLSCPLLLLHLAGLLLSRPHIALLHPFLHPQTPLIISASLLGEPSPTSFCWPSQITKAPLKKSLSLNLAESSVAKKDRCYLIFYTSFCLPSNFTGGSLDWSRVGVGVSYNKLPGVYEVKYNRAGSPGSLEPPSWALQPASRYTDTTTATTKFAYNLFQSWN